MMIPFFFNLSYLLYRVFIGSDVFGDQLVCVTLYNLSSDAVRSGDHVMVGAPQLCADQVSFGSEVGLILPLIHIIKKKNTHLNLLLIARLFHIDRFGVKIQISCL